MKKQKKKWGFGLAVGMLGGKMSVVSLRLPTVRMQTARVVPRRVSVPDRPATPAAPVVVPTPVVVPAPAAVERPRRVRRAERVPVVTGEEIATSDGWHLLSALAKRRGLRTLALRNLCHRLGVPMRRVSQKQVFVRPEDLDHALTVLPEDRRAPSRLAPPPISAEADHTLADMLARRR